MKNSLLSLIFPFHGLAKLAETDENKESAIKSFEEFNSKTKMPRSLILFAENSVYNLFYIQLLSSLLALINSRNIILRVKTSLQFQACLSAVQSRRDAVYITKEKFKSLPLFVHNMPKPDMDGLNSIKFVYFIKYSNKQNIITSI
jgi:hypothetical protein